MTSITTATDADKRFGVLLLSIRADRRAELLQQVVSFRPSEHLYKEFAIGPLRAAFADAWEQRLGQAVPIAALRDALEPPVPTGTLLPILTVKHVDTIAKMHDAIANVLIELQKTVRCQHSMLRWRDEGANLHSLVLDGSAAEGIGEPDAVEL